MKLTQRLLAIILTLQATAAPFDSPETTPPRLFLPKNTGKYTLATPQNIEQYAVLERSLDGQTWTPINIALAEGNDLILNDPLLPKQHALYRIHYIPKNNPQDLDQDGINDLLEYPTKTALNAALPIDPSDGDLYINTTERYNTLAKRDNFPGAQNINEVKFLITDVNTTPKLYFFNVNAHQFHYFFARDVLSYQESLGTFNSQAYFTNTNRQFLAGSLVSHENYLAPDGTQGIYTLEFWPTDPVSFEYIELAYNLVSNNTPFIHRLAYHAPGETQRRLVRQNQDLFDSSAIHTIDTEDLFSSTTYQSLNQQETFGRLIVSTGAETLSARDIVIFQTLPNDLTFVSGIITEVPQTPLSHVNLKAQQNNTPNAFIADASTHPDIAPFLGQNVFYKVTAEGFEIRLATAQEVENHLESIRPTESSYPPRDLSQTQIKSLNDIAFAESDSYGGKAANVAHLGSILPGTAPEGYAIPYYYYDQFMIHNGFYQTLTDMLATPGFQDDPATREQMLEDFRDQIKKNSTLPEWMFIALTELQQTLPSNITPRLRSSANAEDSTNFNGAGLYDSFTHHDDEGHISKSVKQVWASLWNYRAYEEREFYRIDHHTSAMGILVHPNEKEEKSNGVAVARNIFDPNWEGYYINAQAGENLVTNPDPNSVPEELLVANLLGANRYEIQYIRYSSDIPEDQTVLTEEQVLDLVNKMAILNNSFKTLYGERFNPLFAMEIEFKITSSGKLSIKQARPYVN